MLDIHGTKYSYGQPIFFIEHEELTFGKFYDPMADYLESILSYKYVILETLFDESEYNLLDICSSCFPIFLIIYIFRVGNSELETSFGGLMKFFPGYIGNGITIWFSKWKVPQRKRFDFQCIYQCVKDWIKTPYPNGCFAEK